MEGSKGRRAEEPEFWKRMRLGCVRNDDPSTANLSSAGKWQVAMVLEM